MITYRSTRGDRTEYTFSQALLKGLAPDGGLLMPAKTPSISKSQIKSLQNKTYQEIALFLMKKFQTDLPDSTLNRLISNAYNNNFDDPKIAPLVHLRENEAPASLCYDYALHPEHAEGRSGNHVLRSIGSKIPPKRKPSSRSSSSVRLGFSAKGDEYILELWHGPTAAFKDMALQFMPLLFSEALGINKSKYSYLILVATSGDTGAAALEGYKNKKNIKIIALYPDGGVSTIQELTMSTFKAENARVIAVKGDFDSAQTVVKEIFGDEKFNSDLKNQQKILLSAANSINWGRLVPQMIYYLSAYVQLFRQNKIKIGDLVDIAVPSGNLGNIFAAFYIKQMGLPVRKIICASNSNNVLTEFFQTGTIDITGRKIIDTPSPSMNILIPSNLERLLYMVSGSSAKTKKWMEDLKKTKRFSVDTATLKKMQSFIFTDWIDNKATLKCIKDTLEETNYLIDPHTAVAVEVVNRYKKIEKKQIPVIICATAHWSKFPEDTFNAVFGDSEKDIFKIFKKITSRIPGTSVPENIKKLEKKHISSISVLQPQKEIIETEILHFLKK